MENNKFVKWLNSLSEKALKNVLYAFFIALICVGILVFGAVKNATAPKADPKEYIENAVSSAVSNLGADVSGELANIKDNSTIFSDLALDDVAQYYIYKLDSNFSVTVNDFKTEKVNGVYTAKGTLSVTHTDFDKYSESLVESTKSRVEELCDSENISENMEVIDGNAEIISTSDDTYEIFKQALDSCGMTEDIVEITLEYNKDSKDWMIIEVNGGDSLENVLRDLYCGDLYSELSKASIQVSAMVLKDILQEEAYSELLNNTINRILNTTKTVDFSYWIRDKI